MSQPFPQECATKSALCSNGPFSLFNMGVFEKQRSGYFLCTPFLGKSSVAVGTTNPKKRSLVLNPVNFDSFLSKIIVIH